MDVKLPVMDNTTSFLDSETTRTQAIERCEALGDPSKGDGWRRLLHRCGQLLSERRDAYEPVTPSEGVVKASERLIRELQLDLPPRTWGRGAQDAIDHFNSTVRFYKEQKNTSARIISIFQRRGIELSEDIKEQIKNELQ